MKYFMIDIETMGLDTDFDDIIQIAVLEVIKGDDGYYWPGRHYQKTLHTSQKPRTEWIEENHKDLLKVCEFAPRLEASRVRSSLKDFFAVCCEPEKPSLMGLNLGSLDIPFLLKKGFLKKDDYHHRVYELKGAHNVAQDVLNVDSKLLYKRAKDAFPEGKLPDGKPHEALYDCYSQLKTLNGVIRLLRIARAA